MKTTIETLEFPCEIKKNLNKFSFKIFLYDKDTIKVIECEEKQAYFRYDETKKEILFIKKEIEINICIYSFPFENEDLS
ncbi:MAG: hypothetical protein HFG33_00015 [Bacilli bacterium]|nr:hypothetical protein [Bacilli bacterium]